jgi:hypothetical protein
MRILARGWGKFHGTHEIADAALQSLPLGDNPKRLHPDLNHFYSDHGDMVFVTHSHLRLNGDYAVELRLTKADIANLMRLAFAGECFEDVIKHLGSSARARKALVA